MPETIKEKMSINTSAREYIEYEDSLFDNFVKIMLEDPTRFWYDQRTYFYSSWILVWMKKMTKVTHLIKYAPIAFSSPSMVRGKVIWDRRMKDVIGEHMYFYRTMQVLGVKAKTILESYRKRQILKSRLKEGW